MTDHQAALAEANQIRIETMRERFPGWEESLEETSAYLAALGKAPQEYVRAWAVFRPRIAHLRRNHPAFGRVQTRTQGGTRLRPRSAEMVFSDWRAAHAAYRRAR
jgi:hypothetical protein